MLYTYLSKGTIYVTYRKKKNTRSSRREKFLYFIKTLNEVTSSSPTYDISYYIQFKIEFKDDILFNKTTTDNPRHVTLFVGVQYLTAESIKMHNKTSLFKINQSRVNPFRNIRLQKKKNIPHIAIIQRSPIRLKNQAHFNNYISIAHPRELIRNIDHSNRWSIFSLSSSFPICNGVPFPTGMEITTFSPFANNARPPAAQRAREA